jgi:hypothetical protein
MIKVELTEAEWSHLLNAAALAPYAQIAPLIQKIVEQIKETQKQPDLRAVS